MTDASPSPDQHGWEVQAYRVDEPKYTFIGVHLVHTSVRGVVKPELTLRARIPEVGGEYLSVEVRAYGDQMLLPDARVIQVQIREALLQNPEILPEWHAAILARTEQELHTAQAARSGLPPPGAAQIDRPGSWSPPTPQRGGCDIMVLRVASDEVAILVAPAGTDLTQTPPGTQFEPAQRSIGGHIVRLSGEVHDLTALPLSLGDQLRTVVDQAAIPDAWKPTLTQYAETRYRQLRDPGGTRRRSAASGPTAAHPIPTGPPPDDPGRFGGRPTPGPVEPGPAAPGPHRRGPHGSSPHNHGHR